MNKARTCIGKTGSVCARRPSACPGRPPWDPPVSSAQTSTQRTTVAAGAVASWLDHTRGVSPGQSAAVERPWEAGKAALGRSKQTLLSSLALDVQSKAVKVQKECGMFTGETAEEVTERLQAVLALLPGLGPRLAFHSAPELGNLMQDPDELSHSLIRLSELFSGQDVSELVISDTKFADPAYLDRLPEEVERVKALLHVEDAADLFKRRPLLLDSAKVQDALDELTAALPSKIDAARMLREMPCLIYPMNRSMLPQHLME